MRYLHFIEHLPARSAIDEITDGVSLLREIQKHIIEHPDSGDLVQGTGGIRKIRIAGKGKGKSGGFRVWYLHLPLVHIVHILVVYAKNETENLSPAERNKLKLMTDKIKKESQRGKE